MKETPECRIYPWQQPLWQHLLGAHRAGRLPHALLLTGAEGLGKGRLAAAFGQALLCEALSDDGRPCGVCRGCHLFRVGNHPDYRRIEPEAPGKAIKIDTIRAFIDKEPLMAQAEGHKVIVIEPADAMNSAAANSLLKTLEEPTPWTVIILVTSRPGQLPATIRSRCQRIICPVPPRGEAMEWLAGRVETGDPALLLAMSGGAPLLARQLAEPELLQERARMVDELHAALNGQQDPVAIAGRWDKLELHRVLHWMSSWLIDMLRLKFGKQPPTLYNPDQARNLQAMAQAVDFKVLYGMLDRLYEANRTLGSQLNSLMTLESILLAWANSKKTTTRA